MDTWSIYSSTHSSLYPKIKLNHRRAALSGLLQNCLPQVFLQHYPAVGTEVLPRGPGRKKTARALTVGGHADVMQNTA